MCVSYQTFKMTFLGTLFLFAFSMILLMNGDHYLAHNHDQLDFVFQINYVFWVVSDF
jgi:hypothetical protein